MTTTMVSTYELLQLRLKVQGDWIEGEEQSTGFSDAELVRRTYALAGYLEDPLDDQFFRLVGEVLERFAPDVEWANVRRMRAEEYGEGSEQAKSELEGDRGGIERRARLREQARKGGGDDA